jgi:hypothetical protein
METSPQFVGLFGFIFIIANECIAFFTFSINALDCHKGGV